MEQKIEPAFATRIVRHFPQNNSISQIIKLRRTKMIFYDLKTLLYQLTQHWNVLTAFIYLGISHTMVKLSTSISSSRKPSLTAQLKLVSLYHAPTPQAHLYVNVQEMILKLFICFRLLCGQALYFINLFNFSFQHSVCTIWDLNTCLLNYWWHKPPFVFYKSSL